MQRIGIILGAGCLLGMCAYGAWAVSRPPIRALLPSDAIDMHMGVGWWEWTLIYRTPRRLDEWYFPVVHQLEAGGWARSEAGYMGRPLPPVDPAAYERRISFGLVVIRERVDLDGDLYVAHVRMRRWIAIQPLRL
jgi:hypothetical protein